VVHCAGSLRDGGLSYCSGICCLTAIKVSVLMRKRFPQASFHHIHDRLAFTTPAAEAFYREQSRAGIHFVACPALAQLRIDPRADGLQITAPQFRRMRADCVVLATGMASGVGAKALAEQFQIEIGMDGFFKPDHVFLRSVGSSSKGIGLAGACGGPCSASEAVRQGQAAAGNLISQLIPGKVLELECQVAAIDPARCAGCKLCVAVCPYQAIAYDAENAVCQVNDALCQGCGTCAANCPSGAAEAKHFTDQQLAAEMEGLLDERL
jgi:heterodisulfide reductase subunit A